MARFTVYLTEEAEPWVLSRGDVPPVDFPWIVALDVIDPGDRDRGVPSVTAWRTNADIPAVDPGRVAAVQDLILATYEPATVPGGGIVIDAAAEARQ